MVGRPVVTDGQVSFAGGINTVSDDISLQPNQVRVMENARLDEYGAATKRGGSVRTSSAAFANPAVAGFGLVQDSGALQGMVVSNGSLYTIDMANLNGTTTAWTLRTGSPAAGVSTTVTPTFASFISGGSTDVVYIADGGLLNKWTPGTSTFTTDLAGTQDCKVIKVHNQRLWGAGSTSFPDSIFYSALNNGDSLGTGTGGQIVVRTFSDERIVGLASVGSSLLIFHRRGISRLTGFGQDDITVQPEGVSSQTGTIAPLSIVETDGAALFLSDRGAFIASEGQVAPLATSITPDPLLPLLREMNAANLANVRGVLNRRLQEVWWWIPGYGTYVFNLILRAWSGPFTGEFVNTSCMFASLVNSFSETFVIRGDSDNKHVTICDYPSAYTDGGTFSSLNSGTAVSMRVQLRRMYFGEEAASKAFRWGYLNAVLGSSAPMRVDWQSDSSSGTFTVVPPVGGIWDSSLTWDTSRVWGGITSRSYQVPMGADGYYLDINISDTNTSSSPSISRWKMDGFMLGRR